MTVHDHTIFSANCAPDTIQFSYKICTVANIVCMLSHVDVNYVWFFLFVHETKNLHVSNFNETNENIIPPPRLRAAYGRVLCSSY